MSTSAAPTPTPAPVSSPSNGTYYIHAYSLGVYLEFTDSSEGTNLTTWQFTGDTSQQWLVVKSLLTYTFKNVRYGTYVNPPPPNGAYLVANQTPYDWYIEGFMGGYLLSRDPAYSSFWNVDNGFTDNNNPVILYPGGNIWMLDPITPDQLSTTATSTTTSPTPTPTPTPTLQDGTYYISAQGPGIFLEFTDSLEGTNLTTWHFTGDTSQQWQVTGYSLTSYTFRNVQYSTYINPPPPNGGYLVANRTPYSWYIEGFKGGYIFSPDPVFSSFWNVDNGVTDNNNPVILYPGGNIWIFSSVTTNQSSATATNPVSSSGASTDNSVSKPVPLRIVLPATIAPIFLGAILLIIFIRLRHLRSSRRPLTSFFARAKGTYAPGAKFISVGRDHITYITYSGTPQGDQHAAQRQESPPNHT